MKRISRPFIAVEGCIGAGKTTLATKLAAARSAELVLEDFNANPFLHDFYANPAANVFETELNFLLIHYHQLKVANEIGAGGIITDFTFQKDMVFADSNLNDAREKSMFVDLYNFLGQRVKKPDLVIYLQASDELILKRIRERNRSMEQEIDRSYFMKLNRLYDDFFMRRDSGVHIIVADSFDCIGNSDTVQELNREIDGLLAAGVVDSKRV